jgi:hypothetical protein
MNGDGFDRGALVAGLIFILFAVAFLLAEAELIALRLSYLLPLALIVAGIALIFSRSRGGNG